MSERAEITYELARGDRGDAQVHGLDQDPYGGMVVEMWRLKNGKVQFRTGWGEPWRVAKALPPEEVADLLRTAPAVKLRRPKRRAGDVRRERAKKQATVKGGRA